MSRACEDYARLRVRLDELALVTLNAHLTRVRNWALRGLIMTPPSPAAAQVYSEMIAELMARQITTRRARAQVVESISRGPDQLAEIDARLEAITEELRAYGVPILGDTPPASAPHGRSAPTAADLAPDPNTGG